MSRILKINSVGDYGRWGGHTELHPLASVLLHSSFVIYYCDFSWNQFYIVIYIVP